MFRWSRACALCLALGFAASAPRAQAIELENPVGIASYYGHAFDSLRTASGERFDMHAMTAAHPTLPFGTRLRVTNVHNGRQVVVRVNDRGPFIKGRILDLAYGAARKLGLIRRGWGRVRLEVLPLAHTSAATSP